MSSKYIGGEYITDDLNWFLLKETNQVLDFFPRSAAAANSSFFETASDGIAAIINLYKTYPFLRIFVPENFCFATLKVVSQKVKAEKLEICYYDNITSLLNVEDDNFNILLIVHFNSWKNDLLDQHPYLLKKFIVIEDYVQYPFHIKYYKGHYAVNSLRKILPLELAIVYGTPSDLVYNTNMSSYFLLKKEAIQIKTEFIKTENEDLESLYLRLFSKAEEELDSTEIYMAQNSEINLLHQVDFHSILHKRFSNFQLLQSMIVHISNIKILPGEYMFMMILTEVQNELRNYLNSLKIFTGVHWLDSGSDISKKLVSIPIDQRYGKHEITKVGEALNKFFH